MRAGAKKQQQRSTMTSFLFSLSLVSRAVIFQLCANEKQKQREAANQQQQQQQQQRGSGRKQQARCMRVYSGVCRWLIKKNRQNKNAIQRVDGEEDGLVSSKRAVTILFLGQSRLLEAGLCGKRSDLLRRFRKIYSSSKLLLRV